MTQPKKKLVSIILASNRPHNVSQLLYNLFDTCDDYSAIEVLIKIDEGDDAMREYLEMAKETFPIEIRYIQTPKLQGYYTLHYGYNDLWKISNPETYFILGISDEVRMKNKGWDTALRRYIGFFPDDLFRLKLSAQKFRNFYHYYDCGPCPESFSIMTRRWMELAEGFGDCWGPDAWIQNIDFHFGLVSDAAHFRSVPVLDILIDGEVAGLGVAQEQVATRSRRIWQEWWRICSPPVQQEFRRLAVKMQAYVLAHGQKFSDFTIVENKTCQQFNLYLPGKAEPIGIFPYRLSSWYVRMMHVHILMRYFRGTMNGSLSGYVIPSVEPKIRAFAYFQRGIRMVIVGFAAVLVMVLPSDSSLPKGFWRSQKLKLLQMIYYSRVMGRIGDITQMLAIGRKFQEDKYTLLNNASIGKSNELVTIYSDAPSLKTISHQHEKAA